MESDSGELMLNLKKIKTREVTADLKLDCFLECDIIA